MMCSYPSENSKSLNHTNTLARIKLSNSLISDTSSVWEKAENQILLSNFFFPFSKYFIILKVLIQWGFHQGQISKLSYYEAFQKSQSSLSCQ